MLATVTAVDGMAPPGQYPYIIPIAAKIGSKGVLNEVLYTYTDLCHYCTCHYNYITAAKVIAIFFYPIVCYSYA